jgi:hypothetical protein
MRIEEELRVALRLLEQPAPAPADMLRVLDRQRHDTPPAGRASGQRRLGWPRSVSIGGPARLVRGVRARRGWAAETSR